MGTAEEKGKEQANPLVRKRAGKRADVDPPNQSLQVTLPAATIFRSPELSSGGQRT
jgi:hypothetical protein